MASPKNAPDSDQSPAQLTPESLIEVFFHKLSQPLAALYGTLELAVVSNDPAQHREAIARALQETEKITRLFQVMRTFLGVDFSQGSQRVSLNSILEDALQNCRPLAEDRGAQVLCSLSFDMIVSANRRHLTHAFENLLAHSIQASRSGAIQVDASYKEGIIVIRIADGTAWTPEQAINLFDPFPPGHEAPSGQSNNFDLCLSRRIIQAHGGEICACSSPMLTRVLEVNLPNANQQ